MPFLFILEYGHDNPATYVLALLPLYSGVARMKEWGHWQTDVLASWALGGVTGYWASTRDPPDPQRSSARVHGRGAEVVVNGRGRGRPPWRLRFDRGACSSARRTQRRGRGRPAYICLKR